MHRYVHDYTNTHDVSVVDEIMDAGYHIRIGGDELGLEDYKSMVVWALDRFTDLRLVVHEFVYNGERLAMRFSETATSPPHGGARAVWEGIALYTMAGDRLGSCVVEQDFYGRHEQFASAGPVAVPSEDPAVWETPPRPASVDAEDAARGWLARFARSGAGEAAVFVDGTAGAPASVAGEFDVDDLFSSGSTVAFHGTISGVYLGGLSGVPVESEGGVSLGVAGVIRTADGEISGGRIVTDRYGLRRRLLGARDQ